MIESYRIFHVTKPLKRRMVNSLYTAESVYSLILELRSGSHRGYGYVFSYKRRHQLALSLMIEDYLSMILGEDESNPAELHDRLARTLVNIGDTGLTARALSVVDSAVWDLAARRICVPL